MINVNNITSTLAKLPDQALQQYAMMHKNDPYVMSLAVSESNRRKEMRAAQGAQGGTQEQPKVVDAAVAEMAPQAQPMPEDSGIGQLPAGDMEFAGGGILAFAAGDVIPGPANPDPRRGANYPQYGRMPSPPMSDAERAEFERKKEMGGLGLAYEWLSSINERKDALDVARKEKAQVPQQTSEAADARRRFAKTDPRLNTPGSMPMVGPTTETGTPDTTSMGADMASKIQQVAPVAPVAATAAPVEMDIAGKLAALKPFYKDIDNTKAEGIAAAQGKKEVNFANKNVTDEKKLQEEMGAYGAGKEKRLKEREGKLEKDEKSNYGLAFLEAGLAMMGGESPNAFANISKGALQGMGGYKKGLASLNDRKDKLFDAYDALEDAQRSDKKDRFSRTKAAEAGVVAAEGRLSDNMFKLATTEGQTNAETARALATAGISAAGTEYQVQSQTAISNAQIAAGDRRNAATIASSERVAAMPSSEQRLIGSLDPKGKGDPRRGYDEQQRIKSQYSSEGKFNMDTAYADYITKNQATAAITPLMSRAAFAALFGVGPALSATPTGQVQGKLQ
jgi:hypothetical protein